MSGVIQAAEVLDAVRRASQMLVDQRDYLTSLDQAMGDGDMGITMSKIGEALLATTNAVPIDDIGKYLFQQARPPTRPPSPWAPDRRR
jgi:hypothetical protein